MATARGWLTYCAGKRDRSTELAIRRTAASFGIVGGSFGMEDRILDAGVALEALYGPFDDDITRKISRRAAWLLSESKSLCNATLKQMKSFYRTRSKIVHGTASKNHQKRERELIGALDSGRELARRPSPISQSKLPNQMWSTRQQSLQMAPGPHFDFERAILLVVSLYHCHSVRRKRPRSDDHQRIYTRWSPKSHRVPRVADLTRANTPRNPVLALDDCPIPTYASQDVRVQPVR